MVTLIACFLLSAAMNAMVSVVLIGNRRVVGNVYARWFVTLLGAACVTAAILSSSIASHLLHLLIAGQ